MSRAGTQREAVRHGWACFAWLWLFLACLLAPAEALGVVIEPTRFGDDASVNGTCSLREAVRAANLDDPVDECPAGEGADRIVLRPGTYRLDVPGRGEDEAAKGDLDLSSRLTIVGHPGGTVIDGQGIDRVFHILDGEATLEVLTVQGGDAATADGGGMLVSGGGGEVVRSTVLDNAAERGAGLAVSGGRADLDTTTVSGNDSQGEGAGVYASGGVVSLFMSTVADNEIVSDGSGAGLSEEGGLIKLKGTLVAESGEKDADDCAGAISSRGFNLIEAPHPTCVLEDQRESDIFGGGAFVGLSTLGDRGGPTPTHRFQVDPRSLDSSDALNAGPPATACPGLDQRGIPRPQAGRCDIGALEHIELHDFCHVGTYILLGTASGETILGTSDDDLVLARGGDDTVNAGQDADCASGGPNDDRLQGQGGGDVLLGDNGVDELLGGSGADLLFDGAGPGRLLGGSGPDFLLDGLIERGLGDHAEGEGPAVLQGGPGEDTLSAQEGDDRLGGGAGRDRLTGGEGDDFLDGGPGSDRIDCGLGEDRAEADASDSVAQNCEEVT